MDAYSDVNILDTILNNESEEILLKKFINSIGTNSYNIIYKMINYKKKYDMYIMEEINDKIKEVFNIDIIQIYNIDYNEIENSMKIFIDVLNSLHLDFVYIIKKFKFNSLNEIEVNINLVIKQTRGKLRSLLNLLDKDKVLDIIFKLDEIYPLSI